MEGVEPGAGEVEEVVHHLPAVDLGQDQDRCLGPGVQQEGEEHLGLGPSHLLEEGEEVGVGGEEGGPVGGGGHHGGREADTLASGEVHEGTRGVGGAPRHTAVAGGVTRPVAPQPAGAVPATQHAGLYCSLHHLMLGASAGGPEGVGGGEGEVGGAEVGEGGEAGRLGAEPGPPVGLFLAVGGGLPGPLGRMVP